MKKVVLLILLICLFLFQRDISPAEAADRFWDGAEITDVKNKINDIQHDTRGPTGLLFRTSNLPQKLSNITDKVNDVPEIVQNIRDGRNKVDQEMLDAIDDAITIIKENLAMERAGLNTFRGASGDCTSAECIQFRNDLSTLLTNLENLFNTLVELDPGLGIIAQIDLSRLRNIFQTLPAAGLYPLYKATSRDTNLFSSGIIQLLEDMDSDVRMVIDGIRSDIPRTGQCSYILDNLSFYETATSRIRSGGKVLMLLGKIFDAWGSTYVSGKPVQVHGYVGIAVENNFKKALGQFLQGQGDNLVEISSSAHDNMRYCTILDSQAKNAAGQQEILANQQLILDSLDAGGGCELEITSDGQRGKTFQLFVLTTIQGVRTDPTDITVWVDSNAVAFERVSIIPGVFKVELERREIPKWGRFPLTVEAEVSGKLCSSVAVIQRGR